MYIYVTIVLSNIKGAKSEKAVGKRMGEDDERNAKKTATTFRTIDNNHELKVMVTIFVSFARSPPSSLSDGSESVCFAFFDKIIVCEAQESVYSAQRLVCAVSRYFVLNG